MNGIFVYSGVIALLCIFFSWLMYRSNRDIPGVQHMALGMSVYQLGQVLMVLQPLLPVWLGILVANHIFLFALLYILNGTLQFFGKRLSLKLAAAGCLSFSVPFIYFIYAEPDVDARVALSSLMFMTMLTLLIGIITRYRNGNYQVATTLFYTIGGVCILMMCYRLFHVMFIGTLGNMSGTHLAHQLIAGLSLFFSYAMLLGFFLLCNERQVLQIRHLQQQAERMATEKSQFLAFLSHELRTPLNAIVGKTQLIALQTADPVLRYDCELITEAGMELSVITQQVLTQAEAENDQNLVIAEPVWLADWLKRLLDTYRPLAAAKNLELQLQLHNLPEPYVMLNKTKLRQVLTNLISNAIKYSEQGKITLSANYLAQDNSYTFDVTDQGSGIAEHEQSKILRPFSRAGNSQYQEGSGLGLALTQQILNTLNSTLQFHSKLHQGSSFYFSLTLPPAAAPDEPVKIHTEATPVLVVEDIPLNRQIIRGMLQQDGHQPDCVTTLATAREHLKQQYYELIILDINLPDGNGLAFFNELQQTHINPPAVIILTADTRKSLRDSCLAAGVSAVIYKPLSLHTLQQTIAAYQSATALPPVLQLADSNTFLQLAAYLPEERIQQKLSGLAAELSELINNIAVPQQPDSRLQLHKLTSTAATLGLEKLATVCIRLEQNLDLLNKDMVYYLHSLAQYSCDALHKKKYKHD